MFLYHKWLELPLSTRNKIAGEFNIQKKNSTHVVDNIVQSDGYLVKDIEEALNIDAIQKRYNTEETDMVILWDYVVNGKPEPVASLDDILKEANKTPGFAQTFDKEMKRLEKKPTKKVSKNK